MGKIQKWSYIRGKTLGSPLHFFDNGEFSFQKTLNKLVHFMNALNAQFKNIIYLACSVDFIVQNH